MLDLKDYYEKKYQNKKLNNQQINYINNNDYLVNNLKDNEM